MLLAAAARALLRVREKAPPTQALRPGTHHHGHGGRARGRHRGLHSGGKVHGGIERARPSISVFAGHPKMVKKNVSA